MHIKDPIKLVGLIATLLLTGLAIVLYLPDFLDDEDSSQPTETATVINSTPSLPAETKQANPVKPTPPPPTAVVTQPEPPTPSDSPEESKQRELQKVLEQVKALEQENNRLEQKINQDEQKNRKLDVEINKMRPQ